MRWIVPLLVTLAPASLTLAGPALASPADGVSYIFFTGNGSSVSMSGNTDDIRLAERYRTGGGPLLFVREGGTAYVIRDPALLSRAKAIMAPQQEMGRRQGVLGKQQGELGRRQGELGREQGRLGRLMANSTPRQMAELGRRQGELGRQQGELGRQQGELGRRQGELGKEQGRLAELARPQFRAVVDEARRRGIAQRVD